MRLVAETDRLPLTCVVFPTRVDLQPDMSKVRSLLLSYISADEESPGSVEDHKCALVCVTDKVVKEILCKYRCMLCTCTVSL